MNAKSRQGVDISGSRPALEGCVDKASMTLQVMTSALRRAATRKEEHGHFAFACNIFSLLRCTALFPAQGKAEEGS